MHIYTCPALSNRFLRDAMYNLPDGERQFDKHQKPDMQDSLDQGYKMGSIHPCIASSGMSECKNLPSSGFTTHYSRWLQTHPYIMMLGKLPHVHASLLQERLRVEHLTTWRIFSTRRNKELQTKMSPFQGRTSANHHHTWSKHWTHSWAIYREQP